MREQLHSQGYLVLGDSLQYARETVAHNLIGHLDELIRTQRALDDAKGQIAASRAHTDEVRASWPYGRPSWPINWPTIIFLSHACENPGFSRCVGEWPIGFGCFAARARDNHNTAVVRHGKPRPGRRSQDSH